MQVTPYLYFNGDCEAAFKFYEQLFGGKIEAMLPHTGSPAAQHVPAEWQNKILHARLALTNGTLMGSDAPGHYHKPQGYSVSLQLKNIVETERVFNSLAENGKVNIPLQETFFATRFGMLVDRFGIPWMVNCERAGSSA
jgi:PhnB protein